MFQSRRDSPSANERMDAAARIGDMPMYWMLRQEDTSQRRAPTKAGWRDSTSVQRMDVL